MELFIFGTLIGAIKAILKHVFCTNKLKYCHRILSEGRGWELMKNTCDSCMSLFAVITLIDGAVIIL